MNNFDAGGDVDVEKYEDPEDEDLEAPNDIDHATHEDAD